jgi:hypothetical protein
MNNARNMLKQPVVWTISQHEDSIRLAEIITTEAAPAFRDQSALSCLSDSFEDQFRHCIRVIDNN